MEGYLGTKQGTGGKRIYFMKIQEPKKGESDSLKKLPQRKGRNLKSKGGVLTVKGSWEGRVNLLVKRLNEY